MGGLAIIKALMKLLAFDTSTERLHLGACDGPHTLTHQEAGGAQSSARIVPLAMATLNGLGLGLQQLDAIVMGRGPGSFTGLRTACAVAQGLAFGAQVPVLPITVIARDEKKLELADAASKPEFKPVVRKDDRERWNDWGIGMLLQGDLKGAEYAFQRVTEAEPEYADGWLNVARALIQEGETDAAKPYIEKALKLNDKLGRIHFFKAMIEKADGDYDAALASLRRVIEQYPKDRVAQNQLGRILFLKRDYAAAVKALEAVCLIDPEDVQAHYTLMLASRGLKDTEKAAREEKLFRRFKAEEAAQSITGKVRLISPEDNNERQQIHEHESVPLPWQPVKKAAAPVPAQRAAAKAVDAPAPAHAPAGAAIAMLERQ